MSQRGARRVLEHVRYTIPPQPEQPVDESGWNEKCHWAVVLRENRCGNAGEVAISVVHREGNSGCHAAVVAAINEFDHVGHAEQAVPMAAEVSQVIPQHGRVVPDHVQLGVREAVEGEDRHQATPERAERRRESVRADPLEQAAAGQSHGVCTLRPRHP